MALNIKNVETERLAAEVAELCGETKTEAIRRALLDRRAKLMKQPRDRKAELLKLLEEEVWPRIPRRRQRLTKSGREAILGYGREGV